MRWARGRKEDYPRAPDDAGAHPPRADADKPARRTPTPLRRGKNLLGAQKPAGVDDDDASPARRRDAYLITCVLIS